MLQDPGAGTVIESDIQIPSYGGPGVGVGVGVDGAGVGAGVVTGAGARIFVLLSTRAHAVANVEAAASVVSSKRILFIALRFDGARPFASAITSLCAHSRNCACNTRKLT